MARKFTQLLTIVALFLIVLAHENNTTDSDTQVEEGTGDSQPQLKRLNPIKVLKVLWAAVKVTLWFRKRLKCSKDSDCKFGTATCTL